MFGIEINEFARFAIALIAVLVLIALCAWLLRRFGGRALSSVGGRGRQPRLAVIDAATVDARRKLILVRRDDVEHLVMIGGPTDVVIEQNIVHAAPAPRDVQAAPKSAVEDGGTLWPLQPQAEPVLRAQDAAPAMSPPWSAVDQPRDMARPAAGDLSNAVAEPVSVRAEPRLPEPPTGHAPDSPVSVATSYPASTREAPIVMVSESARSAVSGAHDEPRDGARVKHFESLEQEMASLLGRPTGKT